MEEAGHEAAHADAAGNKVPEREERANPLDDEVRKLDFESSSVANEKNPGNCTVSSRERTAGREGPILGVRTKRFMVEMRVNEQRPRGHPRLDHENSSAPGEAAGSFAKETPDVRYVMEYVREHDRAQRHIPKRQLAPVGHQANAGNKENFRGDETRNEVIQVTCARTQL